IVDSLSRPLDAKVIETAIDEYLEIGGMVDAGLGTQVEFDLDNLAKATGRQLSASERETFATVQRQGMRWTYPGSRMTHPRFAGALFELMSAAADRVGQIAPSLS